MSEPDPGSDYLVARLFVGLFALILCALAINIVWEVYTGIVHSKFGTTLRADDPNGFWFDIAFQGAMIAFFAWQVRRFRRFTRRA